MIQSIITDIEGTTTDIKFVKEVLFPFSLNNIESYILANKDNPQIINYIEDATYTIESEDHADDVDLDEVISYLKKWIVEDRKHPALKGIQGLLWQDGYLHHGIKGHIYNDVFPMLKKWKEEDGIVLGIFSSGSVAAQKLLFGNTAIGNINHLFKYNFDTQIGDKISGKSYEKIRNQIGLVPYHILFLSDIEKELDAAQSVGFKTIQLTREGTIPTKKHLNAANFMEVNQLIGSNKL